ncbi:MAG TPA: DNA topoisomerase [Myxococcales bacterium]
MATKKTVKAEAAEKKPKAPRKTAAKKATAEDDGEQPEIATRAKGSTLVVVESPAKAKTIKKYLGSGYVVKASVGHVMDLPKSKIGVDVENGFQPVYEVIEAKKKVVSDLRTAAKGVDRILLATDPDREGEAIAWHVSDVLKKLKIPTQRVLFNEITKKAIQEAIQHPLELNQHTYDAQQARRVLDRLVGYQISPILWKKVRRGLSAGRVQSVAVRLVVEREQEIAAFTPVEYWSIEADLKAALPPQFRSKLIKLDGEKIQLNDAQTATPLVEELKSAAYTVAEVIRKERRRNAPPPFITSKLQQEAANRLGFTAKKTMTLAQRLYEGVELGDEGQTALITYMRTDSVRLSPDAVQGAREYITGRWGKDTCPRSRCSSRPRRARRTPTRLSGPPRSSTRPSACSRTSSATCTGSTS